MVDATDAEVVEFLWDQGLVARSVVPVERVRQAVALGACNAPPVKRDQAGTPVLHQVA